MKRLLFLTITLLFSPVLLGQTAETPLMLPREYSANVLEHNAVPAAGTAPAPSDPFRLVAGEQSEEQKSVQPIQPAFSAPQPVQRPNTAPETAEKATAQFAPAAQKLPVPQNAPVIQPAVSDAATKSHKLQNTNAETFEKKLLEKLGKRFV
ncbi:MAG: hypothetical protein LBN39_09415, partial [Planctomycetaceae bacterium]|nr:hypothetical protein [Planctomycetaceae bacterium]